MARNTLIDSLDAKIETSSGCWSWLACTNHAGYGVIRFEQKNYLVHRLVYTLLIGPIPEGLVLDHLCRTPSCTNPAHLEPVTLAENVRRGNAGKVNNRQAEKTHCTRGGHPLSGDNLYVCPRGKRECKACRKAAIKRSKNLG